VDAVPLNGFKTVDGSIWPRGMFGVSLTRPSLIIRVVYMVVKQSCGVGPLLTQTELTLENVVDANLQEVQMYAKIHRCPCVVITPANDPGATQRHQMISAQLFNKVCAAFLRSFPL
jgi:hypothetical protein